DVVNVYTAGLVVQAMPDPQHPDRLRLQRRKADGQTVPFAPYHFRAGDRLEFFSPHGGTPLGRARVTGVDADGQTVTLDAPVAGIVTDDGRPGDATLAFDQDLATGFVVQTSAFVNSRRHGVWVGAGQ